MKSLIPNPASGRVQFLPLAISLTIWAAYLQAGLPFHVPENAHLHRLDLATGWSGGSEFLPQFILILLVGTFWQSFARYRWPSQPSRSWSFYLGVALILAILFLSLMHGATVRYEFWPITGLIAGLVLGSIVGWFAALQLATWVQASARGLPALWGISVFSAVVLALLPLDTNATLSQTAFAHWNILDRVYQLLKPSILWGALGLICGFAGYGRQARVWGGACAFGFMVCASLAAENFRFDDVVEVIALLPGLAMGLWLGERSRLAGKFAQSEAFSPASSPLAAANPGKAVSPPARTGKLAIESNLRHGDSASSDGRTTLPHRTRLDNKSRYASQDAAESPPRPLSAAALLTRRAFALIMIGATGWALLDFPRWNELLAGGFVLYLALLWRYPKAWLVIVPAALPVLDLAFWTGRFFLDEFDLLLAVTLAALLWRTPDNNRTDSSHVAPLMLATLLMASVLISGLTGLLPLQPLDANAFTSYFSQYNSLRVAKGFLWGMVLFAMLRPYLNEVRPMKLWSASMLIGLAGVAISALWEYWLFSGSSATDYRVTSTFSSMHTGGGHIEAYLVFALPFTWTLLLQEQKIWIRAVALSVFFLAIYALITTVARGGIVALAVVFAVLALGVYRTLRARGMSHNLRYTASTALIAGVLLAIAGLSSATFLQHRFTQTETDAQTRFAHWTHALDLLQDNWGERLFGAGLGTFPGRYFYANFDSSLGNYRYQTEGSNRYLSLNSGGTLYMAQSVAVTPDTPYTLELDVRSNDQTKQLDVPICEKKLLNSHLCQWESVAVTPGKGWQHRSIAFSSEQIGQGAWWAKRPVQLSLYNPQDKGVVDVDNIRLLDRGGTNLISNGDFTQGGDYWFFKSGDHLPWHIKNMWVHLTFEQGLVGLVIFCALIIAAVWRLMRGLWAGEPLATVWLAGISGLLTIGFVDSLLDAPRLAMMLVLALLVGASHKARRDTSR
ncbi:O-antigen ligase [Candidatus Nitrotoga sp. BS]|uniref:O-antigen ligase family protein n=1 Tax=Candidatus Nitrotoga sp. BS TaxID=2890408 RepID=UPI001EF26F4D|nr:O-antigen ligase family protein [Candidatus Nitrotoga sp. BS]CAH1204227.1 O-antigen ligase [Candidatus Nitrotoga sp. BS]